MGLFGDLFDFNNDGKLDSFEKAAELQLHFGVCYIIIKIGDENEIFDSIRHSRFGILL